MTELKMTDKDMGGKLIFNRLRDLEQNYCYVGIHEDSGAYDKGKTVVEVAFFNEFGTDKIPMRSFIRSTFDEQKDGIVDILNENLKKLLDGQKGVSGTTPLSKAGLYLKKEIKRKIRDLKDPPNAPSTIARKGFDDPLIHTRKLHDSIKHKISKENKHG